jgi:hypothetical protein
VLNACVQMGTTEDAQIAAAMYVELPSDEAWDGWEVVGAGKERTTYLSPSGIVYKAGSEESTVAEDTRFTELRETDLADHIPPHTMYRFTVSSSHGDEQTVGVIAMPYLPEDGSVDRNDPLIPRLAGATGDFNPCNVHANRGELFLIDGAGLPGLRDWGRAERAGDG